VTVSCDIVFGSIFSLKGRIPYVSYHLTTPLGLCSGAFWLCSNIYSFATNTIYIKSLALGNG